MRKFRGLFGLVLVSIALGSVVAEYDEIWTGGRSVFTDSKTFPKHETPMHKALFTQRGYIQFLRWELPVPEIEEFTFCLWVKSSNLTYSHSIFSYSKNEEKRLVRSWISPFGRSIHLEIGETEIMAHPTRLEEHRWYHVCLSWENLISRYALWIDGHKAVEDYAAQLQGHVIPSNGDIVVGQEYTDFDKGFEEGIEGAVLGFNLLLVSAFEKPEIFNPPIGPEDEMLAPFVPLGKNRGPAGFGSSNVIRTIPRLNPVLEIRPGIQFRRSAKNPPTIKPYRENLSPRISGQRHVGLFDRTLREYLGEQGPLLAGNMPRRIVRLVQRSRRDVRRAGRIRRRGRRDPLGLQLVDLTYKHCQIGRGSPYVGGSKMLISWTRTPVKVFGGAILKNAKSTCGDF